MHEGTCYGTALTSGQASECRVPRGATTRSGYLSSPACRTWPDGLARAGRYFSQVVLDEDEYEVIRVHGQELGISRETGRWSSGSGQRLMFGSAAGRGQLAKQGEAGLREAACPSPAWPPLP